ncbi:hypothetical protein ABW636_17440 [Aquimarina sp. 2201CG1-2-11]|uniref:hypothetical protein n=1 Tax=Aquimarina discodermiae TaxID=3231043 RepID=UPI00346299AF
MEHFHHKYGQCENCGLAIEKEGVLQPINFWQKIKSRLHPYYLYVCDACFDSQESWCENIYPDNCEICNSLIEDGDHYLEKKKNQNNENINSFGLLPNEKCRIICYACYNSKN